MTNAGHNINNRLTQNCKVIVLTITLIFASLCVENVAAFSFLNKLKRTSKSTSENITDRFSLTFEENLNAPELGKHTESIKQFQLSLAKQLKERGYDVELTRNGEVLIVTIPSEKLFVASDTTLAPKAATALEPLLPLFNNNGIYHILLAYHTDNTGASRYKQQLTQNRVNAIYDWVCSKIENIDLLIPYPMSDFIPIADNNSVKNRKKNRRLEIYLVPENKMEQLAKKNNLRNIIFLK